MRLSRVDEAGVASHIGEKGSPSPPNLGVTGD